MGIEGLLPMIKDILIPVNVKLFRESTVGIDTSSWIYNGAFFCALELAHYPDTTTAYVDHVLKLVKMLLDFGIKPVMVFDGRPLQIKSKTNQKRKEQLAANRTKADKLWSEGNVTEAKKFYQKSVECTPQMVFKVIQALHKIDVDVLVAPYEADAQLAYLSKKNLVQLIITEDSDLIIFGCKRILFKMRHDGSGSLFEEEKFFTFSRTLFNSVDSKQRFRWFSILNGCDYLKFPGIGQMGAKKLISNTLALSSIKEVLEQIPYLLGKQVTNDYIKEFEKADQAFQYQIVFDAGLRKQVPLNETNVVYPSAGEFFETDALQHSLGNLNVKTGDIFGSFDPENWKINEKRHCVYNTNLTKSIWEGQSLYN